MMELDWSSTQVRVGLLVGLVTFVLLLRSRKKKKPRPLPTQEAHRVLPSKAPGKGAPLFAGVRVVELSTVVAAPSCARIMADLGAEVVKVEEPNGDMWRRFFLEYEAGRHSHPKGGKFSTVFEAANVGKSSVVIDYSTPEGKQAMKGLLKDADVFITNVRADALVRAGLDYESLKDELPHLVYGHLTAWGRSGDDKGLPGYDFGAFFNMTGMSHCFHDADSGHYAVYPTAFGDTLTGTNLLGPICFSLAQRVKTGHGQLVDAALLRTGLWALGPSLLQADPKDERGGSDGSQQMFPPDYQTKPAQDKLYRQYAAKDGWIMLLGLGQEADTAARLTKLFGLKTCDEESIAAAFAPLTKGELVSKLKGASISATPMTTGPELFRENTDANGQWAGQNQLPCPEHLSDCYLKPHPDTVLQRLPNIPFDASCSAQHGPGAPAPILGAHTEAFIGAGARWSPIHDGAALKRSQQAPGEYKLPLQGIEVVEICDVGLSIASVGCQLAEYGATVTKVEPQGGDFWRSNDRVFTHYNRGKKSVTADIQSKAGQAKVKELLSSATIFITNLPESQLRSAGLDYASLQKAHPALIFGIVTPWGLGKRESERADLGPFWAASGFAATMAGNAGIDGNNGSPATLPLQLGELATGICLMTGLGTALFHRQRTGEGQMIHSSLVRVGVWVNQMMASWYNFDAEKMTIFAGLPKEQFSRDYYPVPSGNCHRTKDGQWVMLLGVDTARWLVPTIKLFGGIGAVLKVVYIKVSAPKVDKDGKKLSVIGAAMPIFKYCNGVIAGAVAEYNWLDLERVLNEKKMWFCKVQTPAGGAAYKQAWDTDALFHGDCGEHMVSAPVQLSSAQRSTKAPAKA